MIKVENIDVWGFEHAIRGCRNPLNSWHKSDSIFEETSEVGSVKLEIPEIGQNDLDLMKRLYKAGTEHRKYLRQIFVSMDITAPLYWDSELDTYKVGTVRNSCSFMHKGVSKPFEITDFSIHDARAYEVLSPLQKENFELTYPYETNEYRVYECENGRQYKVYRNGRVFACSHEYTDTLGRHRIFKEKECKPLQMYTGYYELNIGGRCGEKWSLHRLVATVWVDNPNDYATVNHIDGNKGNNSAENLEWCTLTENIQKGFDDGLYANMQSLPVRYSKWKGSHRVCDPSVRAQILYDHKHNGLKGTALAEKYNITTKQANTIVFGKDSEFSELFQLCYAWEKVLKTLNDLRDLYLETKDEQVFQQIRCLLPSGYNQRFTITMNYENVVTIIKQRTGHRLDEWNAFVEILKGLPYVKEIMGEQS